MLIFKKHPVLMMVLAMLAIEVMVGFFAFHQSIQQQQQSLIERAKTLAASIDSTEILPLTGSEADNNLPAYQALKRKLIRIGEVNTDVTSVYLNGYRNGAVFFFADSVAFGEVDEATPGLIYDEATPLFISVFTEGKTIFEGPVSDRWGSWVSGIAPIFDPATANVLASVGLDVDGAVYAHTVILLTAIPVLSLGTLFLLILVLFVRYLKNKQFVTLRSKFVSIASHELRSPVAGIVWAVQSLLKRSDVTMDAETQHTMSLIEQSGQQVLGTVREILELSKLQGAEDSKLVMMPVDIRALIGEVIQSMALVAQQARVTMDTDDTFPAKLVIVCDRDKTKRVFSNIITNALKYAYCDSEVHLGYQKEKGMHIVSVENHGVGIPAAEQGEIFKTNFRASNAERSLIAGTGMGLRLVKELMEMQGGEASFRSTPNLVTVFYISFKDR